MIQRNESLRKGESDSSVEVEIVNEGFYHGHLGRSEGMQVVSYLLSQENYFRQRKSQCAVPECEVPEAEACPVVERLLTTIMYYLYVVSLMLEIHPQLKVSSLAED